MSDEELVECLTQEFLRFKKKFSLRFWYDEHDELKFFMTNAPPRNKNISNPVSIVQTPPRTSTSETVVRKARKRRRCPSLATPEIPRSGPVDVSTVNVSNLDVDQVEEIADDNELEDTTEADIPVTNRFDVLSHPDIEHVQTEPEPEPNTSSLESTLVNPEIAGNQYCCVSGCITRVNKPWHHFCRQCYLTHG